MSKRTFFTTVTPLPPGITRETVMETLRNHVEMIDLNPLVEERHPIKPPPTASPEEFHCQWYSLTDRVQYLPGGMASGKVSYNACFHDLEVGLQTHVYAPLGLNIKGKWTMGGSLPGEPIAPVELGLQVPLTGLWLREDVEMKCNFMMTSFVKATLKKSHSTLVSRLLQKAKIVEAAQINKKVEEQSQRGSPVSEYSQQSFSDHNRVQSWAASTQQAQDPQTPNHGFPDERSDDPPLHPKPLSIRSSTSSSVSGSQSGRPAYQESASSGRVSWQTLSTSAARSPPVQHAQPVGQRAPSPYQSPPPGYPTVELRRQDEWNQIIQNEKLAGGQKPPGQYQQQGYGNMQHPGQYEQQQQQQGQYPPGQYPPGQYQQQGQMPPGQYYQQQQGHPGQYQQQQQHPGQIHPPPQELHTEPKPQVFEMA